MAMILAPIPDELLDTAIDVALTAGQADAAWSGRPLCWPCFIQALARRLVGEVFPWARKLGTERPRILQSGWFQENWGLKLRTAGIEAAHDALIIEHGDGR